MDKDAEEAINVTLRVRPLLDKSNQSPWSLNGNSVRLAGETYHNNNIHGEQSFQFGRVFSENDSTKKVYETTAREIVLSACEGYNGTVMAYGPTGSGKTFTIGGSEKGPGFIGLAVHDVFSYIRHCVQREFLLRISYIEFHNECVTDLLAGRSNLNVLEDMERGVYISDCQEEIVLSPKQIFEVLKKGELNRHIGGADYEGRASRSHSMFRMIIESRESGVPTGLVRVSTLNIVDLAGSETIATFSDPERRSETRFINKSLLALTRVVKELAKNHGGYIPYRDSKLTRVLQSALGGNSKTLMVCTMPPELSYIEETLSMLRFAMSAQAIHNEVQMNEVVVNDKVLVQEYSTQINDLKRIIQESNDIHVEKFESLAGMNEHLAKQKKVSDQERIILSDKVTKLEDLLLSASGEERSPPRNKFTGSPQSQSASHMVVEPLSYEYPKVVHRENPREVDQKDFELASMTKRLEDLRGVVKEKENQIDGLRGSMQVTTREMNDLNAEIQRQERELKVKSRELADARKTIHRANEGSITASPEALKQLQVDQSDTTNWKDVVQIQNEALASARLVAMCSGCTMEKISRGHNKAQMRDIRLSSDYKLIEWKPSGPLVKVALRKGKSLEISRVTQIISGAGTSVFQKHSAGGQRTPSKSKSSRSVEPTSSRSFSIVTPDRTLDLIAPSADVCETWVRGLSALLQLQPTPARAMSQC